MKTKTSLWLSLCTLVLCLGVMTFGVYSAISASLNMSGTLGFNMHNCMVTVQGTVYNLAEMPEGQNYANRIDKPIERTIMGGENTTTASLSLGDMYFYYGAYIDPETDTITSKVYDMIFEISFKNVSSTAIKATIPAPTVGTGVTIVTDSASGYTTLPVSDAIIEQNATYTVKFALRLNNLDALTNNVNFSWNDIQFEEYVPKGYTVTITADTNGSMSHIYTLAYIVNGGEDTTFPSKSFTLTNVESLQFSDQGGGNSVYGSYTVSSSIYGEKYYWTDRENGVFIAYSDVYTITQDCSFSLYIVPGGTDPA